MGRVKGAHGVSTKDKIAIVDYGMGNLRSVANGLAEVGAASQLVSKGEDLLNYDKIILPGVGAFSEAMENLHKRELTEPLNACVDAGKHILGICLGMQLMCKQSFEDGIHQGLGWFDADVIEFPKTENLKVPHMGWNAVDFVKDDAIIRGIETGNDVYFVHSYYVDCKNQNDILATALHGQTFTAMLARDNLAGMQFHPEKSQQVGLKMLENFVNG